MIKNQSRLNVIDNILMLYKALENPDKRYEFFLTILFLHHYIQIFEYKLTPQSKHTKNTKEIYGWKKIGKKTPVKLLTYIRRHWALLV